MASAIVVRGARMRRFLGQNLDLDCWIRPLVHGWEIAGWRTRVLEGSVHAVRNGKVTGDMRALEASNGLATAVTTNEATALNRLKHT